MLTYKALKCDGVRVTSYKEKEIWESGKKRATCYGHCSPGSITFSIDWGVGVAPKESKRRPEHDAPFADGLCGIHGVFELSSLPKWFDREEDVIAVMQLDGKIIEHELGARAEYAEPIAVLDTLSGAANFIQMANHEYSWRAVRAARILQVPVMDFSDFDSDLRMLEDA